MSTNSKTSCSRYKFPLHNPFCVFTSARCHWGDIFHVMPVVVPISAKQLNIYDRDSCRSIDQIPRLMNSPKKFLLASTKLRTQPPPGRSLELSRTLSWRLPGRTFEAHHFVLLQYGFYVCIACSRLPGLTNLAFWGFSSMHCILCTWCSAVLSYDTRSRAGRDTTATLASNFVAKSLGKVILLSSSLQPTRRSPASEILADAHAPKIT